MIFNKRREVEGTERTMRSVQENIDEITKVLETVELASSLHCTVQELVTEEIHCGVRKMNGVADDLRELLSNDRVEERGVNVTVDKIRSTFLVRGKNAEVVSNAVKEITDCMNKIVVEVTLKEEQCLYLQRPAALAEMKERHGDGVRFELLARLNKLVLTGGPEKIEGAKRYLAEMDVVTKRYDGLDSKQVAVVIGKHGATIHELSNKYGVVMNVVKDTNKGGNQSTNNNNNDTRGAGATSSLKIIGPAVETDTALSAVKTLIYDNELVQDSYAIEPIMKNELIHNGGASIKEFEASISSAVDTAVYLNVDRLSTNKDNDAAAATATNASPTLVTKCPRFVTERVKKLVVKKIREFESNIVTLTVSPEFIPAIIGKKGSKIDSLQQLGASVSVDSSLGVVKIYSRKEENRTAVKHAIEQIINENQIGYLDVDKKVLGVLFGEFGKEIMTRMNTELSCNVTTIENENDTQLIVKGTQENITKAIELLKAFIEMNQVLEVEIRDEDATLLFLRGDNSLLHAVETKYGIHATYRSNQGVLALCGEMEKMEAAKKDIHEFLYGGEGTAVVKLKVAEDAIGSIVGKGE